jgi:antitoxin CptB
VTTRTPGAETLRRLRWQCRRGLLELDLLLLRFLDQQYAGLAPDQQQAFQRLLERADQSLLAWLQGQECPPDEFRNIITIIKQ